MKKKGLSYALSLLVLAGTVLAGCGGNQAADKDQSAATQSGQPITINFYSVAGGDDYYNKVLVPMFEKATKGKYKVNYGRGGWQEILNKIKAQGDNVNIDVVASGLDGVPAGAKQGLWEQLYPQHANDIHYDELDDTAKAYLKKFNGYGVPNMSALGGPMIAYNSKDVPNPPKTFAELKDWIKTHPKKFTYATVPTSGPGRGFFFGIAQSVGEDFSKPENLNKTWGYLNDIAPSIDSYPSKTDATMKALLDGTVDIIPHIAGWFANLKSQGTVPDYIKVQPLDGKQIVDAHFYVIPKKLSDARKKAALEFINFAMSKEADAQNYMRFNVPTNKNATIDLLTPENKAIYEKGIGVVPPQFKDGEKFILPKDQWVLFPDPEPLNTEYKQWEEKIQAKK